MLLKRENPFVKLERDKNKIFVNRTKERMLFETAALSTLSTSNDTEICVFYGAGGQGKTALCRNLLAMCKEEPSLSSLKHAHIDFGGGTIIEQHHLLLKIRNELSIGGINFPTFDLAFASFWEALLPEREFPKLHKPIFARTGETASVITADTSVEIFKMVMEMGLEITSSIPGIGSLAKKSSSWVMDKSRKQLLQLRHKILKHLNDFDWTESSANPHQILAWFLAQDLNYQRKNNPADGFCIFIDEYERILDKGGAGEKWYENYFEDLLKKLVSECDALLVVFFSRECLDWGDTPEWKDLFSGKQYKLKGLEQKHAFEWIADTIVHEKPVQQVIVDNASIVRGEMVEVYPLLMEIQIAHYEYLTQYEEHQNVDNILAKLKQNTFSLRKKELIKRLLRDYDATVEQTIEIISVCPYFDEHTFEFIIDTFATGLPKGSYRKLMKLSIFQNSNDHSFVLHKAIAEALVEEMEPSLVREYRREIAKHFIERAGSTENINERYFATNAVLEIKLQEDVRDAANWLFDHLFDFDSHIDQFFKLQSYQTLIQALANSNLINTVEYATGLDNMADALFRTGKHNEAENQAKLALSIRETLNDDIFVAMSLNNLGYQYTNLGHYDKAEPLLARSLKIYESSNADIPVKNKTIPLINIAYCYQARNAFDQAEIFLRRALELNENEYGQEHIETARSLNNLCYHLFMYGGDKTEELSYLSRAYKIRKKHHGLYHSEVATSAMNLGIHFLNAERIDEAEELLSLSVKIDEEVYGRKHPQTAHAIGQLASVPWRKRKKNATEKLLLESLEILEFTHEKNHVKIAYAVESLAAFYKEFKDFSKAEAYFLKSISIYQDAFGPDYHKLSNNNAGLAETYALMGKTDLALRAIKSASTIHKNAFGDENDTYINYISFLSQAYMKAGKKQKAVKSMKLAYSISVKLHSFFHPKTEQIKKALDRLSA